MKKLLLAAVLLSLRAGAFAGPNCKAPAVAQQLDFIYKAIMSAGPAADATLQAKLNSDPGLEASGDGHALENAERGQDGSVYVSGAVAYPSRARGAIVVIIQAVTNPRAGTFQSITYKAVVSSGQLIQVMQAQKGPNDAEPQGQEVTPDVARPRWLKNIQGLYCGFQGPASGAPSGPGAGQAPPAEDPSQTTDDIAGRVL